MIEAKRQYCESFGQLFFFSFSCFFFCFFFFFFFLFPRDTDSAVRVRRITAINYKGGRPKGVAEEKRQKKRRETGKEKWTADAACFAHNFHVVGTGRRRYLCAKIKCRCACQHTRTARCCRAQEGGGGGSQVLINIFSGIRSEIKLTARICELFVTGYSRRFPFLLLLSLPSRFSHSCSHYTDYESLQFFSGSLEIILTILGIMISMIFHPKRQSKFTRQVFCSNKTLKSNKNKNCKQNCIQKTIYTTQKFLFLAFSIFFYYIFNYLFYFLFLQEMINA